MAVRCSPKVCSGVCESVAHATGVSQPFRATRIEITRVDCCLVPVSEAENSEGLWLTYCEIRKLPACRNAASSRASVRPASSSLIKGYSSCSALRGGSQDKCNQAGNKKSMESERHFQCHQSLQTNAGNLGSVNKKKDRDYLCKAMLVCLQLPLIVGVEDKTKNFDLQTNIRGCQKLYSMRVRIT